MRGRRSLPVLRVRPSPRTKFWSLTNTPWGNTPTWGILTGPEGRIVHVSMEDKELIDYFTREAAAMGGQYRRHQGTAHPLPFRRRQEQPGGRHLCSGRNGNTRCGRPGHGLAPPLMKNLCGFIRAAGNVPGAISCPEFFQLFLLAAPQCGHSAREFPFSI